jgi:hypothetical protein
MINCVSIFFSCDTFKLYIVNAIKYGHSIFGMPVVYQMCSGDVMSVLWNWFSFIQGVGA